MTQLTVAEALKAIEHCDCYISVRTPIMRDRPNQVLLDGDLTAVQLEAIAFLLRNDVDALAGVQ